MTGPADEGGARVRIERTFRAPAHAVFEAWTSEEVLRRWWHAEHDWETPYAEVDLRIGGTIRVTMRNPHDGGDHGGGGEFIAIDPPRRLAFTWAWDEHPTARQLIEVEFTDHGDRTTVVLTNSGLPKLETEDYEDGWQKSFDNLDVALAA